MAIETGIITAPSFWASALMNGDLMSFDYERLCAAGADERAAFDAFVAALVADGWRVVDVARDAEGNAAEPRFTWSYGLYGGAVSGGEVLDYVIHKHGA